jgi:aspartate racemase
MKKVGIVGGMGPESTIAYYRGLIDAFTPTFGQYGYPEIAIESIDMHALMYHIENSKWDKIAAFIASKFEILREGGAVFGAIASNTPHKVFDEIQSQTFLPLISIVDSVLNYSMQHDLRKLCLLGTKVTMEGDYYQRMFEAENIRLVVPDPAEQDYIHGKIFSEIEFGILKRKTRKGFQTIIDRIIKEEHVDGVIAGCTEIPLLLKADDISVHYIDTARIHIAHIADICNDHTSDRGE